jgi:hypothetical protein
MKIRILSNLNSFLLRERGFWVVFFITILMGAYLYDFSYSLKPYENKEASSSNPTILTLEFADSLSTNKIIESWNKNPNEKEIFATKKSYFSTLKMAKLIIIGDFLFIIFYSILLFLLLNRAFRFYDLAFIGLRYNNWFKIYRETVFFIFVFTIGTFDIIENIIMLLNLNNKGLLDSLISIKIWCVKMKFMFASIAILVVTFVNFNKIIYSFLLDPKNYIKKITKPFSLEN